MLTPAERAIEQALIRNVPDEARGDEPSEIVDMVLDKIEVRGLDI